MPKLIIDGHNVEVAPGTKVIAAAEQMGIMIPRFCYHPALGSVGACRVCAVKVIEGPVKGIQMSCMIDAVDNMVISTTDAEAVDFRRQVIEWLMASHPHDCPVCDEGGHCLLQDMTVSGGHGIRRFPGKKRTHQDQDLGPLIQHEMNRCIQCYRCVRYYREYTGYNDVGVTGIGARVYFGRQKSGTLESPFSGNLIDLCPTGVFTDKPSRFRGRRWDFERSSSVCIHCSLGCHTTVSSRYREIIRQEARYCPDINGYFICDRGRYGFYYAVMENRPRECRVYGKKKPLGAVSGTIGQKIDQVQREKGIETVACLGNAQRSSLETLGAISQLCEDRGWKSPAFWLDAGYAGKVRTAVHGMQEDIRASLDDISRADVVLAVGIDPVNEAPMSTLAMRQAQRNGASVIVINPKQVELPFDYDHVAVPIEDIGRFMAELIRNADPSEPEDTDVLAMFMEKTGSDVIDRETIALAGQLLKDAQRPVILCGTLIIDSVTIRAVSDAVIRLSSSGKKAGLCYAFAGANDVGAAMISNNTAAFDGILKSIEHETVKALILVETDPLGCYPDRERVENAFKKLDLLIVMDYLDSTSARAADIFIPTMTIFEAGGTFINNEGRMQRVFPAYRGGLPIVQANAGNHPPRAFYSEIPGSENVPAWSMFSVFIDSEIDQSDQRRSKIYDRLMKSSPFFNALAGDVPKQGILVYPERRRKWVSSPPIDSYTSDAGQTTGLPVKPFFGADELSRYSPCLQSFKERDRRIGSEK